MIVIKNKAKLLLSISAEDYERIMCRVHRRKKRIKFLFSGRIGHCFLRHRIRTLTMNILFWGVVDDNKRKTQGLKLAQTMVSSVRLNVLATFRERITIC